jgi:putative endonuclease
MVQFAVFKRMIILIDLYIGERERLICRFYSHNELIKKGFATRYRPWFVILVAFYQAKQEVLKREKELKSGQGRACIRSEILPNY